MFRDPYIQKTTFDPAKDFTYIIHLTGYTFGVVVRADAPWKTFNDMIDVRQGQSRQGQLRHAGRRLEPAHHHGADRESEGHQVDAGAVQGRRRQHERAARWAYRRDGGFDRLGELVNAGKFRLLVTWGAQRTKNWPNVPTLKESRHQHGVEFAVRDRRPEGHGPGGREGAARCLQEGHGGAVLQGHDGKLDMEPYYLGTADYHAYAMQQVTEQKQLVEELGLRQQ